MTKLRITSLTRPDLDVGDLHRDHKADDIARYEAEELHPSTRVFTTAELEQAVVLRVEDIWRGRCEAQKYKPFSAKYMTAQAEFFAGASAVFDSPPPFWCFCIMGGRDILRERERAIAAAARK